MTFSGTTKFQAAALAEETNDRAACYKMGRFYEAQEDFQKAVTFYSKAHAYSSAIRIAKVIFGKKNS